jgi:protein SDA1
LDQPFVSITARPTAAATAACRVVGVHKLLLLNFYPFLQKYIAPHQRDVTAVLASLAQAVHELVPPESLAPVLRQLVDQFVHDRWGFFAGLGAWLGA